ncbi:MAG: DUF4391 domain-containing protein [Eubacteriales bacterium]|nr:DUF4391 domain-containing protein [Eubacteriales bacterium]
MLGLPQSTEFNKRIPKQKFYENLTVTPALKRIFVEQIKVITWRNKIAATTVNLAPGKIVTEVEVFEVKLSGIPLNEAVLRQIDREIPYHIIFLLEYEGKYQAWTSYKEASAGSAAFKVGSYYHTDWMEETELLIRIDGLDMDTVHENFVRQIAGNAERGVRNAEWSDELSLKENVERDEKRKRIEKQIAALEKKIRNEKQLNRQVEMNAELKRLKKELNVYDK